MNTNVSFTVKRHTATLVLRNEGRFNAMSLAMWDRLADVLDELRKNESVRVVILRGYGEQAFVSGADITEFESRRSNAEGVAAYDLAVDRAQTALADFPRPVIAAISGICYGGGLALALACDLRYAAPSSRFRMPAARLGLGYGLKGIQRMVALLGAAHASEMFFTASVYDAANALRIGLVSAVDEDPFERAAQVAALVAANAPLTIAAGKLAIRAVLTQDAGLTEASAQAVDACFHSLDYAEGRKAFSEKRQPAFTGR